MMISCASGYPSFNPYSGFQPCATVDSLQTLWPDFDNNRIFLQCKTINRWGIHNCPATLLFSFSHQVCVWPNDWVAPPHPDVITPFPTTQWPGQTTTPGTTSNLEVTIPTMPPPPPTTEPPTDEPPTREPPTEEPPTREPPTEEPPTREPPTEEPPTREPPTKEPPTEEPPTEEPPTTTQNTVIKFKKPQVFNSVKKRRC